MGDKDERSPTDMDGIKNSIKDELKKQLRKEILEEIYRDLKLEEKEKSDKSVHKESIAQPETIVVSPPPVEQLKAKERIFINVTSILKVASHAKKYANDNIPRDKWVEIIGLLAGKYDEKDGTLYIEDAYPMGHGDAIYAEIKDYKNFVRAFTDLKEKGLFLCGWYHSHPSYGLFMSEEDFGTQARYQKLWDKALALVFDPTLLTNSAFGFKLFRAEFQTHKWFSIPYNFKEELTPKQLVELVNFINPIVEGKALYLEYDET